MDAIARRFALEWNVFRHIDPYYEEHLKAWIAALGPSGFAGRKVLDVGCGIGRNPYFFLKWGAKELVAVDIDETTVAVAAKNLSCFPNCRMQRQSVYELPYDDEFDVTTCIGVVHHLEDPKAALRNLLRATKKGGKVLLWLYGSEGNERLLKILLPLRRVTSAWTTDIIAAFAMLLSAVLWLYLNLVETDSPYLRLIKNIHSGYSIRLCMTSLCL